MEGYSAIYEMNMKKCAPELNPPSLSLSVYVDLCLSVSYVTGYGYLGASNIVTVKYSLKGRG